MHADLSAPTRPAPLFEVRGLSRRFPVGGPFGPRRSLRALHDVSFAIARGDSVALVGESGSGKSTLARLVVRLDDPSDGTMLLDGHDVYANEPRATRAYRKRVQMVFQDPFGSLNPAHTIGHHIERPLRLHGQAEGATERARELLVEVGLPADLADSPARSLSGGQRQRVAIARALAVTPDLLVADEPTSMLDVSLRAGVLELFARERAARGLACLFITHDLGAARAAADRVLVLYAGMLVEAGPIEDVLAAPLHPYTKLLVAAALPGDLRAPLPARPGQASSIDPGPGCPFAARCPLVMDRCRDSLPVLSAPSPGRLTRCHLTEP
jgi:peptide/nickel transport system ATP-binding protein